MTEKKKSSTTRSELSKAIKEAREAGKVEARKELGEWIEAHMLKGIVSRTVYSDVLPSIVRRLKEGKGPW